MKRSSPFDESWCASGLDSICFHWCVVSERSSAIGGVSEKERKKKSTSTLTYMHKNITVDLILTAV